MRESCLAGVFCGLAALLLCACAPNSAYRTHVVKAEEVSCPPVSVVRRSDEPVPDNCGRTTPEVAQGIYELHFVEFDDQGWLFPDTPAAPDQLAATPSLQIDHLMKRLTQLLEKGDDLSIIVFVHGWKHNARSDDANVQEFRALLEAAGAEERDRARPGSAPRKVVGIYVAWRGRSWVVPDPLLSLTFWARKEAARRVSIGSARELFARLRSIRSHYNDKQTAGADQTGAVSEQASQRPRIRTLMIGHSFGGLILYAAMSGSLIESLATQQDLAGTGKTPRLAERPADMILLINPAFEASRYEALYRVASRYRPERFQPPLLVSVTSIKDWATGIAFPTGRSVNTLFEHETTSEQGTAMKKTPGHIDHYLTHRLRAHAPGPVPGAGNGGQGDGALCPNWKSEETLRALHGAELGEAVRLNKQIEAENAADFFRQNLTSNHRLKPNWARTFCGGSYLATVNDNSLDDTENAMVWNVEVDGDVIRNHDDVMNPVFRAFMRQLYADVSSHP